MKIGLCLVFLGLGTNIFAQDDAYRNQNWQPKKGKYDVLVTTTITEAGLDVPNANTMLINHAHMFGLSDLHQMRGRVGRSNKKAFCYLLSPPLSTLTSEASPQAFIGNRGVFGFRQWL